MSEEGMNGSADDRRRDEAMRRNMEFIIQQQAEFAADMQRISAMQERAERKWERTEESIRSLLEIAELHAREIGALDAADTRLEDAYVRLLETQQRTEESLSRLSQAQERTDNQLAETNERLNALINVVERYIGDGRNGR